MTVIVSVSTDSPEKCLEVFGQLSTACITWVHGNEDSDSRAHFDDLSKEVEDVLLLADGVLDTLHLDSYDRQHLYGDTVELVEASPGTRLSQSFVDVTDGLKRIKIF